MTIIYEINPPKVIQDTILSHEQLSESVEKLKERAGRAGNLCGGIHLTDSVLGIPRVSPITAGFFIRNANKKLSVTASIRVRDRNLTSITQTICDAILLNLNGVLILKGDSPPAGPTDSGLVPSEVVKQFNQLGFGNKIDMYLSISSNPNFDKLHKKIESQPKGFVTQVIESTEQVERLVDNLKPQGFKVIPCVLVSSQKNQKSAEMLNLDWTKYNKKLPEFVRQIERIAGQVLLSSPNDFNAALELLQSLRS